MARGGREDSRLRRWAARNRWDIGGIAVIVVLTAAYLSPALYKGPSFGGFDLDLTVTSLGSHLYPPPHNVTNSDVVSQFVSWNLLDWRFVHAGHLPLWNEYSLLGTPLFLNFQSSAFSLPALVSYLVPVRFSFLVIVAVRLIVAGTGVYTFSRVAGLRPPGATFAAATFMLSGAFSNWLTWSLSDVVGWMGWMAAFSVLAYRRPDKRRYVVLLAVSVAFSTYAGFPEGSVFAAGLLAVMAAAFALAKLLERRRSGSPQPARPPGPRPPPAEAREPAGALARRGAARVGFGVVAGIALAAPLWLPGEQILRGAFRLTEGRFTGLPLSSLSLLFTQGYDGLPTRAGYFGPVNYYESVSYVGVIAVVLAGVAVIRWWRSALVLALLATLVAGLIATYQTASFHPFESIIWRIHLLRSIDFARSRTAWAFPFAVLAGIGCDTLLSLPAERRVRRAYLVTAGIAVGVVAALCAVAFTDHLGPLRSSERHSSLVWPVALAIVVIGFGAALAVVGGRALGVGAGGGGGDSGGRGAHSARSPRSPGASDADAPAAAGSSPGRGWRIGAFAVLLGAEAAFLLVAGVGINSYSKTFFPTDPAISRLQSIVGSSLVGLSDGNSGYPGQVQMFVPVGLYPNVNIGYGIDQFTGHDPALPRAYFTSWLFPVQYLAGGTAFFFPDIDSASIARHYGISYILAGPLVAQRPAGTTLVAKIAGERLYRVPGAARFAFLGGAGAGGAASGSLPDRVLSVKDEGNGSYSLTIDAPRPATLVVRETSVPGWHATALGRSLRLDRYEGVMQKVRVPAGRYVLHLWYWPERLTTGFGLALAGLLALAGYALWPLARRLATRALRRP